MATIDILQSGGGGPTFVVPEGSTRSFSARALIKPSVSTDRFAARTGAGTDYAAYAPILSPNNALDVVASANVAEGASTDGFTVGFQFQAYDEGSFTARLQGSAALKTSSNTPRGRFSFNVGSTQTIVVTNVAPTLTYPLQDAQSNQFVPVSFSATAYDPGAFDSLRFDWDIGNNGIDFTQTPGSRTSTFAATPLTVGTYPVKLTVSDGDGGSVSQTFTWRVDPAGDFDGNGLLEPKDVDQLLALPVANVTPSTEAFDINRDGKVIPTPLATGSDTDVWVQTLKQTHYGDANLDGQVNFSDLLSLAANYNQSNRGWANGNFDGRNGVTFDDLLTLAANYGAGTAPSSAGIFAWASARSNVPEPSCLFAILALLPRVRLRRRTGPVTNWRTVRLGT
ncbi:MAG: PKD domain-containing protein [Tepidisphaeraceae bacterium]